MSAAELRTMANKFQSKIYRRNIREYTLAACCVAFFGFAIIKSTDPWMKAAELLIIAGLAVYVFILHTRGRADRHGANTVGEDCHHFHINALRRQRDLLRSVWIWGVAPVIPGLALFMGRRIVMAPPQALPTFLTSIAAAVLLLIGTVGLNLWAAHRLQKRLAALGG